jgi:hypothetical protein
MGKILRKGEIQIIFLKMGFQLQEAWEEKNRQIAIFKSCNLLEI